MKRALIVLFLCVTALFFIPSIHLLTQSQSMNIEEENVVYTLPYPGILPDHPLYPIKALRDRILLITTRDNAKKAQIYLNVSNRNMSEAMELADKGKEQLAVRQISKGQDRFLEIAPLLEALKEQGGQYPDDFKIELYQSNAKHREVITEIMKKTTQTEIGSIESLLKKNETAQLSIDSLP